MVETDMSGTNVVSRICPYTMNNLLYALSQDLAIYIIHVMHIYKLLGCHHINCFLYNFFTVGEKFMKVQAQTVNTLGVT